MPKCRIELSAAAARRFLVERHLLAPPRSLPAEPHSVMTVVERLAVLQFDPLEVPGARNHDLVLHARIAGYRRGWCEQWLYGPDRRLFEIYNKSLNMVPIEELPHYRLTLDAPAATTTAARTLTRARRRGRRHPGRRSRQRGPLTTADFAQHSHSVDWWWAPTRASRAVLEALFVSGRVGISTARGQPPLLRPDRAARAGGDPGRARRPTSLPRSTGCCRASARSA